MNLTVFLATLLLFATNVFAQKSSIIQKVLPDIAGNLSGITYNPDSDSYFLIQNNSGAIFEYKEDFEKPVRTIRMINLLDLDTEDIVYLGNNEYALSTESNHVLIVKIDNSQTVLDANESRDDVQLMPLPRAEKKNKGLEGVCFSKKRNMLFAVQEKKPIRIFEWPRPAHKADVPDSSKLGLKEPYDIGRLLKNIMSDLSACHYDDDKDQLLLLSHESSRVMYVNRQGQAVSTLDLPPVALQYEGMTLSKDGKLVLVSEPNIVVILN